MSSNSRCLRPLAVLALTVVLMLTVAAPAMAALEDDIIATSTTHPWEPDNPETWWRNGWGSSLYPEITFPSAPYDINSVTLGFLYRMDRSVDTTPEAGDPFISLSTDKLGSVSTHVFDVWGVYSNPPVGGWPAAHPGASLPYEGEWYIHIRFFNQYRLSDRTLHYRLYIDRTKPQAPTGFDDGIAGENDGTWTDYSRRDFRFTKGGYDTLSGVALYRYWLNGTYVGDIASADHIPAAFSIEDLPAGKNKVELAVLDQAGNVSSRVSMQANVDTDTPTVTIKQPSGSLVGVSSVFEADPKDQAGISAVDFYVDNIKIKSLSSAPWKFSYDTKNFGSGAHTLKVTAKDMFGRTAEATKSFTVDAAPPRITNVFDSPDPFYPVIADGYRDTGKIAFQLSENANVYLKIYKPNGVLWKQMKTYRRAGANVISWDGKGNDGTIMIGSLKYRLIAYDAAGNKAVTGLFSTTIRDYIIVRTGSNAVKVLPR